MANTFTLFTSLHLRVHNLFSDKYKKHTDSMLGNHSPAKNVYACSAKNGT